MVSGRVESFVVPTAEDTCQLLSAINSNNGVYLDYDMVLEFMFYYYRAVDKNKRELCRYLRIPDMKMLNADKIKNVILSKGYAKYFPRTATNDISLAAKELDSVFSSQIIDEETKWIVKTWSDASGYASTVSQFDKVLQVGQICDEETYNGHRMLRLEPLWIAQNTGRFAMQQPAIHNFADIVKDCVTVPKGYVLVGVDSGQIDPRLTFSVKMPDKQIQELIVLYNDAYFGILHYVLMPEEDIRSGKTSFEKMEITDDLQQKRKKLKTYINAVIYNSQDDEGDPIKASLIKRIGKHPMHVKWVNELNNQLMTGNYVVYTAFGTPVDVRKGTNTSSSGKYSNASEESKFNHYLRSAINAPIQGTAADLHRLAIEDEKKFLLYRASRSFIMMSIHDAIYTAVHEDDYDAEIEFLSHCPEYRIDGWVPILCEAEVGQHQANPVFKGKRY